MIEAREARAAQAKTSRRALALAAPIAFVTLGAGMLLLYWWGRDLHRFTQWIAAYVGLFIGQFAMYAVACWLALKWRGQTSRHMWLKLGAIVFFSVAFRAALVPQRPYLSVDVYRYVWDGHIQAQKVNPYLYMPDAPEMEPLRDDAKFPNVNKIYPNMGWWHLRSPYPPAAQAIYLLIYLIHPLSVIAFKTAALVFDLVTVLALMLVLARSKLDPARAIIFAWHPLVIFEGAHSGHIEAAFMAMLSLALLAWVSKKPTLTGVALALAALVKFYPALVIPAFMRSTESGGDSRSRSDFTAAHRFRAALLNRSNLVMLGAFLATVLVVYMPYALSGATGFGSLTNEFHEEGFTGDGVRYFLLALAHKIGPMPTTIFLVLSVALLCGFCLRWMIKEKRDVTDVARGSASLIALYLILSSPHYSWYYAWIIPFLCFAPSMGWLYLTGASVFMYLLWYEPLVYPDMPIWLGVAVYVPAVAWLAWENVKGRRQKAEGRV
ncbi:MAG TPA: glycosyltransferase family 87 protein [Blastocatellia bacterium]|nr:glycosyltransferase family 87 protein [Blastocatellia bacterium]